MCVEQRSPTFSIEPLPEENSCPSVCREKNLGPGWVGLMRAMTDRFWGTSCAILLELKFLVPKISQKMSNSQMCLAWGRVAPIGREKAEFLKEMHPKCLQRHVQYFYSLFSVRTNVTCGRSLAFLIVGCSGSVEDSWAGENAGIPKKVVSAVFEGSGLLILFRLMWCAYSKHLAWAETAAGI